MIKANELLHIMPLLILAGSVVVILMTLAVRRNHLLTNILTMIALVAATWSFIYIPPGVQRINTLFTMDGFGRLFMFLILLSTLVITIISYSYLEKQEGNKEEYYVLLLTGTLGSSVLVIATHFISFFLGLELLSVSVYILAGYVRTSEKGMESAIKYLILAGVSSAFLLMGMAMLYGQTGTMEFGGLAEKFSENGVYQPLTLTGFSLLIVGIGFKMAIVPFHLWTPDVYEGAPAPTTAFIASVSKGGVVALLIRFFMAWEGFYFQSMVLAFSIIAILSMLVGNLLALTQRNVKRILAYSSIAHLGYVLVAFLAAGEQGAEAVGFYLAAYMVTIIGAFGVVSMISEGETEAYDLEEYKGLFWQRPWVASIFTILLFSLAGIPLTAGFIGKFYVLSAGISKGLWLLSLALVVGSVIGLYYYLRIIVAMFRQPAGSPVKSRFSLSTHIALVILILLVIWLGINPNGVAEIIQAAAISSFVH